MTAPQKRDPEATRQTILGAAEALILEKGFAATSVSEIAKRAGVTKSLIHHHFGSKEGLWTAVKMLKVSEYFGQQMSMLRNPDSSDNLLRDSIVTYFHFLQSHPEVIRLLTWMTLEAEMPCTEEQKELFDLALRRLTEFQEAGALRSDVRPAFILISFLSLVQGWFRAHGAPDMMLMGLEPSEDLNREYLEAMLKLFFEGVLSRPD